MTVKANCHQVDCDINPLTPATWTQEAVYTRTILYDSFVVSAGSMHLLAEDPTLTAGTATVEDLGGGEYKVGIPIQASGIIAGEYLRLIGTDNYDSAIPPYYPFEVLEVDANYVYILSPTNVAEVFDGDEYYVRTIYDSTLTGVQTYEAIHIGDYIYSTQDLNYYPLRRIKVSDWTNENDWIGYAFPQREFGVLTRKKASDDTFLYLTVENTVFDDYIYKINLSTAEVVWKSVEIEYPLCFAIDDEDRLITRVSGVGICVINDADGTVEESYEVGDPEGNQRAFPAGFTPGARIVSYTDETTGYIVNGIFGRQLSTAGTMYNYPMSIRCDNVTGANHFYMAWTNGGSYTGSGQSCYQAFYSDGYIFLHYEDITYEGILTNVFRLKLNVDANGNISLAELKQYYLQYLYNVFEGSDGNIWTTWQPAQPTRPYDIAIFGTDLSIDPETTYEFNLDIVAYHTQWHTFTGRHSDVYSVASQSRTAAYPQDYSHLEGQIVQVLADGIYLDDTTYTIVSGAVSPTYTATIDHVGLKIISRLQPMKLDGESDVKRIAKLILNVFESVAGKYGEDLTTLYTMELKTTGDIMDPDGALYTGYVELPFRGVYDRQGDIWLVQDIPLPLNPLGIGVNFSKEEVR